MTYVTAVSDTLLNYSSPSSASSGSGDFVLVFPEELLVPRDMIDIATCYFYVEESVLASPAIHPLLAKCAGRPQFCMDCIIIPLMETCEPEVDSLSPQVLELTVRKGIAECLETRVRHISSLYSAAPSSSVNPSQRSIRIVSELLRAIALHKRQLPATVFLRLRSPLIRSGLFYVTKKHFYGHEALDLRAEPLSVAALELFAASLDFNELLTGIVSTFKQPPDLATLIPNLLAFHMAMQTNNHQIGEKFASLTDLLRKLNLEAESTHEPAATTSW